MALCASSRNAFGVARQQRASSLASPSWSKLARTGRNAPGVVSRAVQATETPTAKETVTKFYTAYNTGDSDTIAACMAEDVNYHDMIYAEPFRGRNAVVEYMKNVREEVPKDLQFVIEEIAGEENKCGIRWHVEIGEGSDRGEGIQFPFSRGCSFYTTNDKGEILTARDIVEPPAKPGGATMGILTAVSPIVRALGPNLPI